MKILITNQQLWPFRGSENWCYAVAKELIRRNHEVSIYSIMPRQGKEVFERAGIKFVNSGNFDLILENHSILPKECHGNVIIHTCHGRIYEERPMKDVINVAVSDITAERWGLGKVIYNGIDCNRMKPIRTVNQQVTNILSLCSSYEADNVLKNIAETRGYNFMSTYGKEVMDVERLINWADLVFGVGRSVLDAMACARPVISFDCRSYIHPMHGKGYVTPEMVKNDDTNMTGPDNVWTVESLIKEMDKYDPEDGMKNREFILKYRNIEETVDRYLELYQEAINERQRET